MFVIDQSTLQKGRRALQRAVALHLNDPNVTHIDLGLRIVQKEGNRLDNQLTVRVHLRKKLSGSDFEAFAIKYPERIINPQVIGFPIDIPEADYRLQYTWPYYTQFAGPRASHFPTLKGGISISNSRSWGFGTLGGFVVDKQSGDEMLLSNWHVLAGSWFVRPGLPIYQPAYGDGGTGRDTIGMFARDATNLQMDAAVANLTGSRKWVNEQLGIGPVRGIESARIGMHVTKSGRRSNITTGMITGIEGYTMQRLGGLRRIVKNIVHISQTGSNEVSAPGDSGSWWLAKETQRAVALHFAGSNMPEFGLAISMPHVLDALNVELFL